MRAHPSWAHPQRPKSVLSRPHKLLHLAQCRNIWKLSNKKINFAIEKGLRLMPSKIHGPYWKCPVLSKVNQSTPESFRTTESTLLAKRPFTWTTILYGPYTFFAFKLQLVTSDWVQSLIRQNGDDVHSRYQKYVRHQNVRHKYSALKCFVPNILLMPNILCPSWTAPK